YALSLHVALPIFQNSLPMFQSLDFSRYDTDPKAFQFFCPFPGEGIGIREKDEFLGEVVDQGSQVKGFFPGGPNPGTAAPKFIAMAVGTMDHGLSPAFGESLHLGQDVPDSGGQYKFLRAKTFPFIGGYPKGAVHTPYPLDVALVEMHRGIFGYLPSGQAGNFHGGLSVKGEKLVGMGGESIAGFTAIDD